MANTKSLIRILYGVASFLFEVLLAVECFAACVALGSLILAAIIFSTMGWK